MKWNAGCTHMRSDLLPNGPLIRNNFNEIWLKYKDFHSKKCIQKVFCKTVAIFRPVCIICCFTDAALLLVPAYNRMVFASEATDNSTQGPCWCAILIAHQIVMAKHGGSCVHFSGISTCGRTSRETVSHSQRQLLPTPHKIALPVYVTVTNKRLQPLTTTLCNSLVLSFSLLTTKRRLIKHLSFLCVLRSSQLCRRC